MYCAGSFGSQMSADSADEWQPIQAFFSSGTEFSSNTAAGNFEPAGFVSAGLESLAAPTAAGALAGMPGDLASAAWPFSAGAAAFLSSADPAKAATTNSNIGARRSRSFFMELPSRGFPRGRRQRRAGPWRADPAGALSSSCAQS